MPRLDPPPRPPTPPSRAYGLAALAIWAVVIAALAAAQDHPRLARLGRPVAPPPCVRPYAGG